jgi:hypothetical protein
MDLLQIIGRKRQQIEELETRLAALRADLATLERAKEIAESEGDGSVGAVVSSAPPAEPVHASNATPAPEPTASPAQPRKLVDSIRDIVKTLPEPFSTVAVRERLAKEEPELSATAHYSSLSGTMRRMAGRELVLVAKGGPGKEATYRRQRPGESLEFDPQEGNEARTP